MRKPLRKGPLFATDPGVKQAHFLSIVDGIAARPVSIIRRRKIAVEDDWNRAAMILREMIQVYSPIEIAMFHSIGGEPLDPNHWISQCCDLEDSAIRAKNGPCVKQIADTHILHMFCETHWRKLLVSNPLFRNIPTERIEKNKKIGDSEMKYVVTEQNGSKRGFGQFLKPEVLAQLLRTKKAKSVEVVIDERAPNRAAEEAKDSGPFTGKFGIDVPISFDGVRYVLTMPTWAQDFNTLLEELGDDLGEWCQKKLRLSLGTTDAGATIIRVQTVD